MTWRHWSKNVFLAVRLETIVIYSTVVDDVVVELLRSPKEEIEKGHGKNISLKSVFICTNLERDLDGVADLDSTRVTWLLDLVRVWILLLDQL